MIIRLQHFKMWKQRLLCFGKIWCWKQYWYGWLHCNRKDVGFLWSISKSYQQKKVSRWQSLLNNVFKFTLKDSKFGLIYSFFSIVFKNWPWYMTREAVDRRKANGFQIAKHLVLNRLMDVKRHAWALKCVLQSITTNLISIAF